MTLSPPPFTHEVAGFRVVRDDLLLGGTKRRVLERLMRRGERHAYASPAQGMAQVALAAAAAATGAQAAVFVPERRLLSPQTAEALRLGAHVVEVRPGYLTVCTARAREWASVAGAYLWPHGLDEPRFIDTLAGIARAMREEPDEVWCVAGSGVLTRSLQLAWPKAAHHAVLVGHDCDTGAATRHRAPERFDQPARELPPYPSHRGYDAKAWQFIAREAAPGALVWNVA